MRKQRGGWREGRGRNGHAPIPMGAQILGQEAKGKEPKSVVDLQSAQFLQARVEASIKEVDGAIKVAEAHEDLKEYVPVLGQFRRNLEAGLGGISRLHVVALCRAASEVLASYQAQLQNVEAALGAPEPEPEGRKLELPEAGQ